MRLLLVALYQTYRRMFSDTYYRVINTGSQDLARVVHSGVL